VVGFGSGEQIKYKAVEVGLVDAIAVSDDLSHVIVHATLDKDAAPHLREGTQFWVVRPRIGSGGISGLSTIVSGAYISIMPGPNLRARLPGVIDGNSRSVKPSVVPLSLLPSLIRSPAL